MDDPRLTPARPDLAAKYLEGRVKAARYVTGEEFCVCEAVAPVREAPAADAMLSTQALKGERVTIYDRDSEGFAWGQLNDDGYVGWIPEGALARSAAAPTHKVTALRTFAFPGPSIKLPPVETLPMGARVTITREDGAGVAARKSALSSRASWFETTHCVGLLTMRGQIPDAAIFEVDPHGEEARSAVSNHEGPSSVTNPSRSPPAERTHQPIAQRLEPVGPIPYTSSARSD